MRLDDVLPDAPADAEKQLDVCNLAYDNRVVGPGSMFFCVPGFAQDGHDFAHDAVARGAAAIVVERELTGIPVPQLKVKSVRVAMATASNNFFHNPTAELGVVGITGTNGKTTTAFLVRELLEADRRQTGLLGTVKSVVAGVEHEVQRTTPEAIDLQRTFREMVDGGDRACAMEVSSHALVLHRADAIHFDVAIFTNLTQDHLDFHPTMEDYFQAKRRLFVAGDGRPGGARAVINVEDPYGARLAAELDEATTFALHANADYRARDVHTSLDGTRFTVETPDGPLEIRSPLRGEFNVSNALAALAAARALGVPAETCVAALGSAGQIPGRFETVDAGQPFAVLVDFAHTPDSLENVLRAARGLTNNRLRVVFGCGGDRDRGKRPQMGEIARRLADDVIVTSDNPRSEDPEAIIDEILTGSGHEVAHDPDREAAIARALAEAQPGDVVVIAGKGHEQGQEFADGYKIPFDDVAVTRALLAEISR